MFTVSPAAGDQPPSGAPREGREPPGGEPTPVLLVHGTGSDHTTWRVAGPLLAARHPAYALDRRGRGATPDVVAWTAAAEVADVAAVAEALAHRHGRPVAVVGHSLGGRLALAAAPGAPAIGRVVAYESAADGDAGHRHAQRRRAAELAALLAAGRLDAVLERFLRDIAGLPGDELDAFRASPLWESRVATAPTIVRELLAALDDPAIGPEATAAVTVPVLQLAGSASPAGFRAAAAALDARLPRGRLAIVDGARHNAHHTHPHAFADAVGAFLGR